MNVTAYAVDWYRCSKCAVSFLVDQRDPDRHLLKKQMRCPNFRTCNSRVYYKATGNVPVTDDSRRITALALFQAAAGIGLPGERKCSPTEIRKLVTGSKVRAVHLEKTSDPNKSIIMSMTFDNGKTIHFSSSTRGSIVYKVTE